MPGTRPGAPASSTLTVTGPIVSRPYLDMTLRLMEQFRISFTERSEGVFALEPALQPSPAEVNVGGDWSQAAVLLCMNAMGCGVMVPNEPKRPPGRRARGGCAARHGHAHFPCCGRAVCRQPLARGPDARADRLLRHSRPCAHPGAHLYAGARRFHPHGGQPPAPEGMRPPGRHARSCSCSLARG